MITRESVSKGNNALITDMINVYINRGLAPEDVYPRLWANIALRVASNELDINILIGLYVDMMIRAIGMRVALQEAPPNLRAQLLEWIDDV